MAKRRYCGFCGKSDDDVERFVAGPCIEVCNECVDAMYQIIHAPKPLLPVKQSTHKPRKVIQFREYAAKRKSR